MSAARTRGGGPQTEPTQTEPTQTEPTQTEPTQTEPTPTEPTPTEPTTALSGIGVCPGRVAGPVAWRHPAPTQAPPASPPGDAGTDPSRIADALASVAADLRERSSAAATVEAADVLEATALMADDPAVREAAAALVRDAGLAAPRAVWDVLGQYAASLEQAGGYLAERSRDVLDLRDRVVARLTGRPLPGMPAPGHRFVLVADDLAPADTAELDPATTLAVVTCEGGPTGHTAIIARALGVPTVVACADARGLADGDEVLVDGLAGTVTPAAAAGLAPGTVFRTGAAVDDTDRAVRLPAGGARLGDGTSVSLLANVGDAEGARAAAAVGATGSGLFRTELLFLHRSSPPTRAEQAAAYTEVLRHLPGPVVVRTLDAGADKPLPFLSLDEPNPALGVRGLRAMATRTELLDDQLGAIADAREATGTTVWVMAPMVTTPDEAGWFKQRCTAAGLDVAGVMIEVPAAALLAGEVLDRVDFASVGTNDLTQYTTAADRVLGAVAELNDPWQPAVLRLVAMAARAGADTGRHVGVCGEAAADPLLAAVLVGLGVRSLSATASALPAVAAHLAGVTLDACRDAAEAATAAPSARQARRDAATALQAPEEVARHARTA